MPTYQTPGVYIEEVESGSKPIQAVGTSVAAFVGFTQKRPADNHGEPVLVTSWTQYQENFGSFIPDAFLPLSVYGYFLNGGGVCFVQSLMTIDEAASKTPSGTPAAVTRPSLTLPGSTPAITAALEVQPQVDGALTVVVEAPGTPGSDDLFKFTVRGNGTEESFDNVTFAKGRGIRNVVDVVNKESKLVKVKELDSTSAPNERRPANNTYEIAAPLATTTPAASTVTSAAAITTQGTFQGDLTARVGLAGLEAIDEVTMVCVPDLMAGYLAGKLTREDVKAIQLAVISHCELMKDRFAILDALPELTPQQVLDWRMNEAGYDSKYAALYYPWIYVANPLANSGGPSAIKMPPSGHLAGLYARVDGTRGVHKAPANEVLRGALRLETQVTHGEQSLLNPKGINCIRSFPGRGIRVWGARTLSSDTSWTYINVRRLFNMIEESIFEGTQWVVFEPNDPDLWERVKRSVAAFLSNVWRSGALFGLTPEEAFYVKCDAELNPPSIRDAGQLIVEIGLAPVKPAEFVIFRFSQMSGVSE